MKFEEYFKIWGTYELIDGVYNVDGDVELVKRVEKLPFKFGKVSGTFYCYYNYLTSLEGSPTSIGGDFCCHYNKLKSLECCPTYVGGAFRCDENLHNTKEFKQHLILRKLRK